MAIQWEQLRGHKWQKPVFESYVSVISIQWRHKERDGVSNHGLVDCSLSRYIRRADQRKHQIPASLAFMREIHWMNSSHKGLVTRKMLPFDDVIISLKSIWDQIAKYKCLGVEHLTSATGWVISSLWTIISTKSDAGHSLLCFID